MSKDYYDDSDNDSHNDSDYDDFPHGVGVDCDCGHCSSCSIQYLGGYCSEGNSSDDEYQPDLKKLPILKLSPKLAKASKYYPEEEEELNTSLAHLIFLRLNKDTKLYR